MHAVGPTKAELVTVHEQRNFEEIRQTAGRTNLPRVHLDELEREVG